MRALTLLVVVAFAVAPAAAQKERHQTKGGEAAGLGQDADPRTSWEGSYLFQEGGGRGSFVEHTIKVYRQGSHLVADLDAAGFQTAVSMSCDAKAEGAKLNLYFHSYRDENVGEPYRKGQLLLSLEKAGPSRRARLLTNWGAYRPVFRRPKGAGVYFRKT
jgi:hypothetical protein